MSSLASFFSGPPSAVQAQVDAATSEYLLGPDWGKNMEICDDINRKPGSCNEFIKAFKKRFATKKPKVIMLTIKLIDSVVKNCGHEIHTKLSQKWVGFLESPARGKRGPEVQEEALALVQRCAKAFKGMQREAPMFSKLYMQLQKEGYHFANDAELSSAVFAPPQEVIAHAREERSRTQMQAARRVTASRSTRPRQNTMSESRRREVIVKLKQDLNVARDRANRFVKLVTDVKSGVKVTSDAYLDEVDFLSQCQLRVRELIEAGTRGTINESVFSLCLDVNGMIGDALRDAQRLREGGLQAARTAKSSEGPSEAPLLDLGGGAAAGGELKNAKQFMENDIFDMGKTSSAQNGGSIGEQVGAKKDRGSTVAQNPFDLFDGGTSTDYGQPRANQSLSKAKSVDDMFDALFEDDGAVPTASTQPPNLPLPNLNSSKSSGNNQKG
jgi:hypothetical protein|eukprot:g5749.t1